MVQHRRTESKGIEIVKETDGSHTIRSFVNMYGFLEKLRKTCNVMKNTNDYYGTTLNLSEDEWQKFKQVISEL